MAEQNASPPGDPTVNNLATDRRASVRYLNETDTFSYSLGRGSDICLVAKVLDLSPSGIGLRLAQRIEPGTILNVELQSKSQRLPYFLLARVVHATEQADGSWVAGCHFARQLAENELQALL